MERRRPVLLEVDTVRRIIVRNNINIITAIKDKKKVSRFVVVGFFSRNLIRFSNFEDSYLAKMNRVKKGSHFKPYSGQDYETFKKNYGFGTGYLGFDFDNPNYKEKVEDFILINLDDICFLLYLE